jgi:hypothetical protein
VFGKPAERFSDRRGLPLPEILSLGAVDQDQFDPDLQRWGRGPSSPCAFGSRWGRGWRGLRRWLLGIIGVRSSVVHSSS